MKLKHLTAALLFAGTSLSHTNYGGRSPYGEFTDPLQNTSLKVQYLDQDPPTPEAIEKMGELVIKTNAIQSNSKLPKIQLKTQQFSTMTTEGGQTLPIALNTQEISEVNDGIQTIHFLLHNNDCHAAALQTPEDPFALHFRLLELVTLAERSQMMLPHKINQLTQAEHFSRHPIPAGDLPKPMSKKESYAIYRDYIVTMMDQFIAEVESTNPKTAADLQLSLLTKLHHYLFGDTPKKASDKFDAECAKSPATALAKATWLKDRELAAKKAYRNANGITETPKNPLLLSGELVMQAQHALAQQVSSSEAPKTSTERLEALNTLVTVCSDQQAFLSAFPDLADNQELKINKTKALTTLLQKLIQATPLTPKELLTYPPLLAGILLDYEIKATELEEAAARDAIETKANARIEELTQAIQRSLQEARHKEEASGKKVSSDPTEKETM